MQRLAWRLIFGLATGLLSSLAAAGVVSAQSPAGTENQTYGDWTVRCGEHDNAPPCDMLQVVFDKEKQPVMILSIGHAGHQEQYGLQIGVPLGVLVSGGVLLRIDDNDEIQGLKFTRCLSTGCQIEARLAPDRLESLRRGKRGILAILDGGGQPVVFPISLKGFAASMDVVATKNRSWAQADNR